MTSEQIKNDETNLRDYLAAKAMQEFMRSSWNFTDENIIAKKAYKFADAMIKERNQKGKK
jgi:hypothetical protein